MVLENQHGELKNIFLDSFESVLLAFHFSGYSELAHTKTIYQIFNCSIADGLILAHVNKIDMYCADDPWNALDEFDENEESEYDQEF